MQNATEDFFFPIERSFSQGGTVNYKLSFLDELLLDIQEALNRFKTVCFPENLFGNDAEITQTDTVSQNK